jgi:hypothetical protein
VTAPEWTAIPEVRAALVDTVLPAAVALLPSTITVAGRSWPLHAPQVWYGDPPESARPQSLIIVGPAGDLAQEYDGLQDRTGSRRETFGLLVRIWYAIGDQSQTAQRVAVESSWAIYRACQEAVRETDPDPFAFLREARRSLFTNVIDRDFYTDNGRASQLDLTFEVESRV